MDNRNLTSQEHRLVRWMLEHGEPEAAKFLPQLELAQVTPWQCGCGCASINFQILGMPAPPPGVHVLSNYVFGEVDDISGIFVFASAGILGGVEVYGLSGDARVGCQSRSFCVHLLKGTVSPGLK